MFQQQLYNLFSLLCLFFVTIICLMVNHQFSDDVNGVDHHILLPGFHICYVNCFKLLQRSIDNFDMNWKIGYRQFQHGTILNSIENVYETFQKFRRKLVVISRNKRIMIWSKYFSNSSPLKRQRYFWSYPLQFLLSHLLRILCNNCSSCSSSAVLSQDYVALKIYKRLVWMFSHYPFHY